MASPNWTRAAIALFASLLLATSWLTGDSLDDNFLRWASAATSGVVLILLVYERWAWRWPVVRKGAEWTGRPVLHGTWKGSLDYERNADDQPGTIAFYMSISQTFSKIQVRSFVSTSESHSIAASIEQPAPNHRRLVFAYRSEAPHDARDRNRPHDGTCVLNIAGIPVRDISGSYYTDRLRRGRIRLGEHTRVVAESFAHAETLAYSLTSAPDPRTAATSR